MIKRKKTLEAGILKIATFALGFALLSGCATQQKKFETELAKGACDQALLDIPEKTTGAKFISSTHQAGGTLLSYAFTGASYTAEILWDITGGTVMFLGLCGPIIAVEALAINNGGGASGQVVCLSGFPEKIDRLGAPPLGRKAYRSTANLRCPPLEGLSQSIRQVASCFAGQKTSQSQARARKTLESIRNSGEFYNCLNSEEQKSVDQALAELPSIN